MYSTVYAVYNILSDSILFGNAQRKDPMGDGSLQAPRFDPKGKSRASTPANGDILALDLGSAEEGTAAHNGDAFMQMQLVEQQVCLHLPSLIAPVLIT